MKKYIPVFGDQSLFDGAPFDCEMIYADPDSDCVVFYKIIDRDVWFKFELNQDYEKLKNLKYPSNEIMAMRRIIKEPKRWTWEDKKAGRLPEVGCNVSSVAYGYVCSVVAIDSNSRHIWCQFPDQSVGSCMTFEINPIETPAEKAKREEDEWVNKAWSETAVFAGVTQDEHDRLRIHLRHIYRAQLSGELAAPKGGDKA